MMTDMDNEDILLDGDDDILLEGMDGIDAADAEDLDSSLAELMAEANAFLDGVEDEDDKKSYDLGKTIETMAATQLCVHPQHYHSFTKVTFTLGASLRKCAACNQGFKSVSVFGTSASAVDATDGPADSSIVKCVACGALAHRSCAFDSNIEWAEPCPVNSPSVKKETTGADAFVVTDDEEEVTGREFEMELNDTLKNNNTSQSDDEGSVKRNSSFLSNASDDESMDTQDLDEGEEERELVTANAKLPNSNDETDRNCVTPPPGHSPNGVARRAISNLLFPKRREEGTDNPYAGGSDQESVKENGGETASQGDINDDTPLTPTKGSKRTWFGNSPKKSSSQSKGKAEEEEEPNPEDSPKNGGRARLGWFSANKRRTNSSTKDNQNAKAASGDDNGAAAAEDCSVASGNSKTESIGSAGVHHLDAGPSPRAPWLSTSHANGVEEDYGEDVNLTSQARTDNIPSEVETVENQTSSNDTNNTAGRRGWFQRRQNAPEPSSNDPSPAPKPRGFGLFGKKRSQRELDPATKTDKDALNSNTTEETAEEENPAFEVEVEAEFDEFLDVEEDESKKPKPVTAESARADFNDFLDVSDEESDKEDNEEEGGEGGAEDGGKEKEMREGSPNPEDKVCGMKEDKKEHEKEADEEAEREGEEDVAKTPHTRDQETISRKRLEPASETKEKNEGKPVEPPSQAEQNKQNKMAEPPLEENKGLLGFGLFRRKKAAESTTKENVKESANVQSDAMATTDGATSRECFDDAATQVAQAKETTDEEKQLEDSQMDPNSTENDNPTTPTTTTPKPRFRLFARRGDESGSKTEPPEAEPIPVVQETTPQASPRIGSVLINSLWKRNDDSESENREAAFKDESNTIEIIEEPNDAETENQIKPSLFTRVFTPSKSKAEDEGYMNLEQTGDTGDDETAEESDEANPRRFGLFASKKVADVNSNESKKEESDNNADTTEEAEKPSARKFTLFGFRRSGKEEQGDANAQQDQSWASDEPPTHWTTATTATFQNSRLVGEEYDDQVEGQAEQESEPLHYANHPFASVSVALQENIMALLSDGEQKVEEMEVNDEEQEDTGSATTPLKPKSSLSLIVSPDAPDPPQSDDMALGEIKPEPVQENTLLKVASGTYEAVKATAMAQKKMGMASVAGGIAGGVAGLMFAGPAGAVMGVRYGQTAGALGVVLEGSLTVGVIVAGVAGGRFTAEKIQEQIEEQRVLTIGERGIARKVMLVRPTIHIDPAWHSICAEAQRTSPSSSSSAFSLFTGTDSLKQDRYERTSDICEEEDIPTEEKVLLLVSRVLSDRDSFPGHVYRCLMQSFRDRCKQRDELRGQLARNKDDTPHNRDSDSADADPAALRDNSDLSLSPRARREDAHGVIKYITGTLLEVRPGLASTPEITETTASVVEALVFGEVYDLVYEEIAIEATEKDKNLIEKIDDFEYARLERTGKPLPTAGIVSKDAIDALKKLPETHAAVDKLGFCVVFLEKLSDHFAASVSDTAMGADSLLKMVCQHIIAARMPCVNAEVAFLEEFARDEQLLRGKEGYALVTLQAALHFLNMSNDFERDIFGQDNDEENVPIVAPDTEPEEALHEEQPARDDMADDDHEPDACMPPNAEAKSVENGDQTSDLEHSSVASSSDEKVVAEIEAREEKKEDEPIAEDDLL